MPTRGSFAVKREIVDLHFGFSRRKMKLLTYNVAFRSET